MTAREYEDVVYSSKNNLFFCLTRVGTELESWNVDDPLSPKMDWRLEHNEELMFDSLYYPWPSRSEGDLRRKQFCWHLKYLVFDEQRDQLFLVVRHVNPQLRLNGSVQRSRNIFSKYRGCDYSYPYKTNDFDVYKIDRGGGKVRYMKDSLDGLAMFVGMNHSYAVSASVSASASASSELKPNSIYFGDENRLMWLSHSNVHNEYGGHDNGIFNYQNKTFSYCSCSKCPLNPLVYGHIKRIYPPPLWYFNPGTNLS